MGLSLVLSACNPDDPNKLLGGSPANGGKPCPPSAGGEGGQAPTTVGNGGGSSTGTTTGGGNGGPKTVLDERVVSYSEALRTASLKLAGKLPKNDEIEGIRSAEDPKKVYETFVDQYMASPRFASAMIDFWKNTFRSGAMAPGETPNRDTAPLFAAKITVEGADFRQMFTATAGTCPTYDAATGTFTPGDCANGPTAAPAAGVLTDAGLMAQYASALAFRRVRFIQETFSCSKMPAEYTSKPEPKGQGFYTSPWPFESIAGAANGGRVDFLDYSSTICANCHGTMNHRAPLFAAFDDSGTYVEPVVGGDGFLEFSATVPIDGNPKVKMSDYLPPGETTGFKFGAPAANMLEFGQRMAADDEVARCAVVRVWNFAMSKGDAVYDLADVPESVIGPLLTQFKTNYNLRDVIRAAFVHDDFVRY
ncbi:hypothetical protein [Polyangium spumosum]|uniref:Cytochrome c domain-containing protein n=1 Tax=Polyangium spumosum TaxID=889282 RepID=A0A6N7PN85_9BACT|nr:hypothetical protein [Polyangium spumosum]MRG93533.1 hypothetical protein [Polyangium spumosum]